MFLKLVELFYLPTMLFIKFIGWIVVEDIPPKATFKLLTLLLRLLQNSTSIAPFTIEISSSLRLLTLYARTYCVL